jgi:hypothetical protein
MGSKVQSKAFGTQKRNLLVIKILISHVTYPSIRAQKREIQKIRVKKILYLV